MMMYPVERIETVYTEEEWMKHVEAHCRDILLRWTKRKLEKLKVVIKYGFIFYLIYAACYFVAYQW